MPSPNNQPTKGDLAWNTALFIVILIVMGLIAVGKMARCAEHFKAVGPDGGALIVCHEREGYNDCVPDGPMYNSDGHRVR